MIRASRHPRPAVRCPEVQVGVGTWSRTLFRQRGTAGRVEEGCGEMSQETEGVSVRRATANLEPLSRMSGYRISPDSPDIRGWPLVDRRDEKVGKIDDLLINTDDDVAVFAVVDYGPRPGTGDTTLVPLDQVRLDRDRQLVVLRATADDLRSAPRYYDGMKDYERSYRYWDFVSSTRRAEEHGKAEPAEAARRVVKIPIEVYIRPTGEEEEEEQEEEEAETRRGFRYTP